MGAAVCEQNKTDERCGRELRVRVTQWRQAGDFGENVVATPIIEPALSSDTIGKHERTSATSHSSLNTSVLNCFAKNKCWGCRTATVAKGGHKASRVIGKGGETSFAAVLKQSLDTRPCKTLAG